MKCFSIWNRNEWTNPKKILSSKQKILDHKNHQVYSPNEKKNVIDVNKRKKRCTVHKYKLFL